MPRIPTSFGRGRAMEPVAAEVTIVASGVVVVVL
jgi:hypothetical protein